MQEWSYFRGGLSTIDRDYGIFNKIHHDIGTHVVHHLFPQMPHYNLTEATEVRPPSLGQTVHRVQHSNSRALATPEGQPTGFWVQCTADASGVSSVVAEAM